MVKFFGGGKGEGPKPWPELSWEERKEMQLNRSAEQFAKEWRANGGTPEQFKEECVFKTKIGVSGIEVTREYGHMKMALWEEFFKHKEGPQPEQLREYTEALKEVVKRTYNLMTKN